MCKTRSCESKKNSKNNTVDVIHGGRLYQINTQRMSIAGPGVSQWPRTLRKKLID